MIRVLDLNSRSCGFKLSSDHYLELINGRPEFNSSAMLVVCFLPIGDFNLVGLL